MHTHTLNYWFTNQSDPPPRLFNREYKTEKTEGRAREDKSVCAKEECGERKKRSKEGKRRERWRRSREKRTGVSIIHKLLLHLE